MSDFTSNEKVIICLVVSGVCFWGAYKFGFPTMPFLIFGALGLLCLGFAYKIFTEQSRDNMVADMRDLIEHDLKYLDEYHDDVRWQGSKSKVIYFGESFWLRNGDNHYAGLRQSAVCQTEKGNWFIVEVEASYMKGRADSYRIVGTGEQAAKSFIASHSIRDAEHIFGRLETA
jgi:hypothetical protein